MKYKRIKFFIVSLIGVIVISCLAVAAFNDSLPKNLSEDATIPQNSSYSGNYNLIYGDWEVTGYLAEGKGCNKELLKSTIGTQISYRYNEITINGSKCLVKQYVPYVIAMEDRILFIGSDYYPSDENFIFNTDSAYFVAFDSIVCGENILDLAMSQIIVKDNNTLILKTDGGYCVLDRTAFLNNLDILIPPV